MIAEIKGFERFKNFSSFDRCNNVEAEVFYEMDTLQNFFDFSICTDIKGSDFYEF